MRQQASQSRITTFPLYLTYDPVLVSGNMVKYPKNGRTCNYDLGAIHALDVDADLSLDNHGALWPFSGRLGPRLA